MAYSQLLNLFLLSEFMQRFLLTDPSIYSEDDPETAFGVNCFVKAEDGQIPVQKGDIVILRAIQVR